jgi:hypothetical protein
LIAPAYKNRRIKSRVLGTVLNRVFLKAIGTYLPAGGRSTGELPRGRRCHSEIATAPATAGIDPHTGDRDAVLFQNNVLLVEADALDQSPEVDPRFGDGNAGNQRLEEGNLVQPAYYGMSPDFPSETLVTVTFAEHEGKTKLAFSRPSSSRSRSATGLSRAGPNPWTVSPNA